ncbi:hypothetical protein TH61_05580 [Rufibacter sp. DG15C]|nr:hypothetical protein TH61_05580 [Rufibacter sp. DG15C]
MRGGAGRAGALRLPLPRGLRRRKITDGESGGGGHRAARQRGQAPVRRDVIAGPLPGGGAGDRWQRPVAGHPGRQDPTGLPRQQPLSPSGWMRELPAPCHGPPARWG